MFSPECIDLIVGAGSKPARLECGFVAGLLDDLILVHPVETGCCCEDEIE